MKCKHIFCSECIEAALKVFNKCPVCQQPQGIIQGNQPSGQMIFLVDRYSVPGYEGKIPNREKPTRRVRAEQRLRRCRDGRDLESKLVSFVKGFSKNPCILAIFKEDSEYLRFPFKVK